MSYSLDLREKAIAALKKGYLKSEVNEMFGLGINTLRSWEKLEEETGSLKSRPITHEPIKINREALLKYYEENSDSTNRETANAFNCSVSGIRSAKAVLKITRKKN
ncbi:hypothetical protein AGMMS49975_26260 [Clostridia bacterium]|nr:hypothetical protein AGMMS49975_26260 [Clostridia bacterium]